MHDLLFRTRRDHGGIGAVLEPHQHRHLGSERPPVEIEGFVAAPVEVQIRLDLHCRVPFLVEEKFNRR